MQPCVLMNDRSSGPSASEMRVRMIAVGISLREKHGAAFAVEFLAENGVDPESARRVLCSSSSHPACCRNLSLLPVSHA